MFLKYYKAILSANLAASCFSMKVEILFASNSYLVLKKAYWNIFYNYILCPWSPVSITHWIREKFCSLLRSFPIWPIIHPPLYPITSNTYLPTPITTPT